MALRSWPNPNPNRHHSRPSITSPRSSNHRIAWWYRVSTSSQSFHVLQAECSQLDLVQDKTWTISKHNLLMISIHNLNLTWINRSRQLPNRNLKPTWTTNPSIIPSKPRFHSRSTHCDQMTSESASSANESSTGVMRNQWKQRSLSSLDKERKLLS